MCLPSPVGLGFSLLPVALVGVQARGFFYAIVNLRLVTCLM